jgi:hypothetical protein
MGSDDTSAPVVMLVNSSELLTTDFHLTEVNPLQLDTVAHGDRRTRDIGEGHGKMTQRTHPTKRRRRHL